MKLLKVNVVHSNSIASRPEFLFEKIKTALYLAQCFAIFPLLGLNSGNVNDLRFEWNSIITIYVLLGIMGKLFVTFMCFYRMCLNGIRFYRVVAFIFYGSTMFTSILFLIISKEFPKLMREWNRIEISMNSYKKRAGLLRKHFFVITIIIMSSAALEHILVIMKNIRIAIKCTDGKFIDTYFMHSSYPQVFTYIPYTLWMGIICQVVNLLSVFVWNFMDLFIILMSMAMALRFRQINNELEITVKFQLPNLTIWKKVREDYNKLSKLCRKLDHTISALILTSFLINLCFILIQLYGSIDFGGDLLDHSYFFFSFGFLFLRTILVCLYGSWVHDESKKPMVLLNSVSSSVYNFEIKRFLQQTCISTPTLTGKGFFKVTRNTILSIAGAIVTYELVIMEFNKNSLDFDYYMPPNITVPC